MDYSINSPVRNMILIKIFFSFLIPLNFQISNQIFLVSSAMNNLLCRSFNRSIADDSSPLHSHNIKMAKAKIAMKIPSIASSPQVIIFSYSQKAVCEEEKANLFLLIKLLRGLYWIKYLMLFEF